MPETFTKEETLDILKIRYILSTNSFKKYVPVTLATNVSEETVAEIMDLLRDINRRSGQTILMVTHSPEAAKSSSRIITVQDGILV